MLARLIFSNIWRLRIFSARYRLLFLFFLSKFRDIFAIGLFISFLIYLTYTQGRAALRTLTSACHCICLSLLMLYWLGEGYFHFFSLLLSDAFEYWLAKADAYIEMMLKRMLLATAAHCYKAWAYALSFELFYYFIVIIYGCICWYFIREQGYGILVSAEIYSVVWQYCMYWFYSIFFLLAIKEGLIRFIYKAALLQFSSPRYTKAKQIGY